MYLLHGSSSWQQKPQASDCFKIFNLESVPAICLLSEGFGKGLYIPQSQATALSGSNGLTPIDTTGCLHAAVRTMSYMVRQQQSHFFYDRFRRSKYLPRGSSS